MFGTGRPFLESSGFIPPLRLTLRISATVKILSLETPVLWFGNS